MASIKSLKNPDIYVCKYCNYKTCNKKDLNKHILTLKHQKLVNASKMLVDLSSKKFICDCGKSYAHDSSYYRHKKNCIYKVDNISHNIVKEEDDKDDKKDDKNGKEDDKNGKEDDKNGKEEEDDKQEISKNGINLDKELFMMLINQNKELLEIVKNGTSNTNHSHNTTNSHNKAFNLNFFLNETCKNAMNITDFVDSIKLQLSDLMEVGELGYVDGISKIIVKNLNNLDETIRPVHCTDKKRETMYIKDEGEWNKEDEKKSKLKKVINKIADKNIRLLPQFREKYPEYNNSSSKTSDIYEKVVIEAMTTDQDKKEKIIKNISKVTTIKENR
jgi:hypothetical protein